MAPTSALFAISVSIVRGDRYRTTLTLSRTEPAAALPWAPPMRHAGISVGSDDASAARTTA